MSRISRVWLTLDALLLFNRLVNSATVEAQEIYDKLLLREETSFRLALFSLQRYLRVCFRHPLVPAHRTDQTHRKKILPASFSSGRVSIYWSMSSHPVMGTLSRYVAIFCWVFCPALISNKVCAHGNEKPDGPRVRLGGVGQ